MKKQKSYQLPKEAGRLILWLAVLALALPKASRSQTIEFSEQSGVIKDVCAVTPSNIQSMMTQFKDFLSFNYMFAFDEPAPNFHTCAYHIPPIATKRPRLDGSLDQGRKDNHRSGHRWRYEQLPWPASPPQDAHQSSGGHPRRCRRTWKLPRFRGE